MKMSVRPLACQLRVFQRRHSEKHFSSFTHKMAAKASGHWNYVTVTIMYAAGGARGTVSAAARTVSEVLRRPAHTRPRRRRSASHASGRLASSRNCVFALRLLLSLWVKKKFKIGEYLAELQARAWLAPLKPRQQGALQILYCIVLYCLMHFAWPTHC